MSVSFYSELPQQAVEAAFRIIEQGTMKGLPVCNEDLTTEVVNLNRLGEYWTGVLITPWTMQLIMLPASDQAECLQEGDARTFDYPQGSVVFMASDNPDLGVYLACALKSPVLEFKSQEEIRSTAIEVMDLLFQPAAEVGEGESVVLASPGRLDIEKDKVDDKVGSRRDFLRGRLKSK